MTHYSDADSSSEATVLSEHSISFPPSPPPSPPPCRLHNLTDLYHIIAAVSAKVVRQHQLATFANKDIPDNSAPLSVCREDFLAIERLLGEASEKVKSLLDLLNSEELKEKTEY